MDTPEQINQSDNHVKNFQIYHELAELGNVTSQFLLGKHYEFGLGTARDMDKAVECYKIAFDNGYKKALGALNRVANYYYEGKVVTLDYQKAFDIFQIAANGNYAESQFKLATLISRKEIVKYSDGNASLVVYWLKKAAAQGHAPAQFSLGVCHYQAKGTPKNNNEALKYFTLASEQGNADAKFYLAEMYERGFPGAKGIAIPQDMTKAMELYEEAKNLGHKQQAKLALEKIKPRVINTDEVKLVL